MGAELVGDAIRFTAVNVGTYTIYLNKTGTDSEFEKYAVTNPTTARRFVLQMDNNGEFVGENGIDFTNPHTVAANDPYVERRDVAMINQIKVRTDAANTVVRVRWN